MGLYSEHYWKLEKYKQNFEKILEKLQSEKDIDIKYNLAVFAASYFVNNNSGYYTSSVLEKFFTDYAKSIKIDLSNIEYKKNSVLHILTEGYTTGGHTRVVERWIENAPEEQIHSVAITTPNNAPLDTLKNNAKAKNGYYIPFDNDISLKEKAVKLRKLAAEYEYIVLHTHMEDPIPLIAFGTDEFKRPVLLYNHASHMPWLGKSIADIVLDIEKDDPVTKEKRGINNTYFLGVPSKEISISIPNKKEIRKKLNLPTDKKIIVSSGRDARYRTISGKSFIDYVKEIIDNDTYCYVIGVNPKKKEWKNAARETKNHIIPIKFIDFSNGFTNYLKAADLYLDSYPLGGGTAMIDAISSGTPAISLESVYPQFDYLTNTSAYCKTEEEFIKKAKKVLNDKNFANELYEELKSSLIEYQSIDAWNKKTENLYKIAPKQHKVKDLSDVIDYSEPNDLSVLCNVIVNKKFLGLKKIKLFTDKDISKIIKYGELYKKQGIPFIFQILSYKKSGHKTKIFKLFGISIYKYIKK